MSDDIKDTTEQLPVESTEPKLDAELAKLDETTPTTTTEGKEDEQAEGENQADEKDNIDQSTNKKKKKNKKKNKNKNKNKNQQEEENNKEEEEKTEEPTKDATPEEVKEPNVEEAKIEDNQNEQSKAFVNGSRRVLV